MNFSEMGRLYEKLAKKSMSLLRKDLKEAGYWYSSAADCYRMEGDEEKFRHLKKLALKCFSDFLKDKEKKRVMDAGQVYLWISHIYHSFGDANKFHRFAVRAAEAFSLAARRMAESDKTALQAIIGYYNSANCYRLIGDEKNAERGYRKALSIYRQPRVLQHSLNPRVLLSGKHEQKDGEKTLRRGKNPPRHRKAVSPRTRDSGSLPNDARQQEKRGRAG
ncbi:MAG: hypothetical protein ACTSSA_16150 [Candidatus Freyarchaeota archaeon]